MLFGVWWHRPVGGFIRHEATLNYNGDVPAADALDDRDVVATVLAPGCGPVRSGGASHCGMGFSVRLATSLTPVRVGGPVVLRPSPETSVSWQSAAAPARGRGR